jgi:hypothetical protein
MMGDRCLAKEKRHDIQVANWLDAWLLIPIDLALRLIHNFT